MIDRPRWLRRELSYVILGSALLLSALSVLGEIEPIVVLAGVAILVVSNRVTARLNTGRWDGIPSDERRADR